MIMELAKRVGLNRIKPLYYVYHKYLCDDPHPLNMPSRPTVMDTDGQRFWVSNPAESYIGRSIFFHGAWEPDATAVVDRHVNRGMTVVDVGAHTGYYSLLFAKRIGRTGRVIAFEPEAVGLDYLRRNIALNQHENVTIVPLALSDWSGTAAIEGKTYLCVPSVFADAREHASDRSDAAGLALRRAGRIDVTSAADNPIRTAAFDELVPELGIRRLDFVKIDVEGAEWHVLKGMRASLERWSPGLLLEIHPPQLKRSGQSESEVLRLLDDLGYARQLVGPPSPSGVYTVYARRS
ncbi:MAG: FkbM family methyltransferase [Planctomycetes bacterium]|nr:FkbM family methyltransferase [Planctomycetota bacterium]